MQCGLCCGGVLHDGIRVRSEEVEPLTSLGFAVTARQDGLAFDLPCRFLADTRCDVYSRRPESCRSYRCKLLEGYLVGQLSLAAGLDKVQRVRQLVTQITDRLPSGAVSRSLWARLRDGGGARVLAATTDAPQEFLMDVTELLMLIASSFKHRPASRRVEAT